MQVAGEVVGGRGVVVELWEQGVEDLGGDAAVKPVIDLLPFPGGEGLRIELVGVDDLHSSRPLDLRLAIHASIN